VYWVILTLAVMAKCFYFLDTLPDSTTGIFEENSPLGRPSHMSEDNTKMNIRIRTGSIWHPDSYSVGTWHSSLGGQAVGTLS